MGGGMKHETKRFILRDGKIRGALKTHLDTLPLDIKKYDLEAPHCKKAEEYLAVDGKKRYKCEHEPDPIEVLVKPYKKNRSLAQNNLMWKWLTLIANYIREEHGALLLEYAGNCPDADDLKDFYQRRFLGFKTYPMPGYEYLADRVVGTSDLNTAQFTAFLNCIEVYANSELGVQLPHPEDLYYEAMGK